MNTIAPSTLLAVLTTLVTGCVHSAPLRAPLAVEVPILAVSERQDEWLHTYCAPKKVVTVWSIDEGAHVVHDSGGTLGEVVYENGNELDVVSFACASRPQWVP